MKTNDSSLSSGSFSRIVLAAALLALPATGFAGAAAAAPKDEAKGAKAGTVKAHVLAPTERINVSVEGEQDLQKLVALDDKGEADLGLIRKIKLGGLTVDQAARAIEKAYIDGLFLRRPKVSLTVESQVVQTVTVLGQVKQSGKIVIPSDQDVDIVDVIIAAQGFNELARESAVKVTRILEDGTQKTWDNIDVGAFLNGKKERKDALVILPGDIINVPMRIF
jgi:protein involved in polysaccharide export with SLBB domain